MKPYDVAKVNSTLFYFGVGLQMYVKIYVFVSENVWKSGKFVVSRLQLW